jgi:hypothetical protein
MFKLLKYYIYLVIIYFIANNLNIIYNFTYLNTYFK